jgi:hypothetical protein
MVGGTEDMYHQASVVRWLIPARDGMPPLKAYWYDGSGLEPKLAGAVAGRISTPNYPPMMTDFEKQYDCDFREGWDGGTLYIGTKGVMWTEVMGQFPRILPDTAHAAFPVPPQRLPRIKGENPYTHFFECCKTGKPTCADFEYAAAITEFLLLGHLAIRAGPGAIVQWNGPEMSCTNLPGLNRYLGRTCRKGWEA